MSLRLVICVRCWRFRCRHIHRCDNNVYRSQKVFVPVKLLNCENALRIKKLTAVVDAGGGGTPSPEQRFEFHLEIVERARANTSHPVSLRLILYSFVGLLFFISVDEFRLALEKCER